MTEPTTTPEPNPIVAEVYPSRRFLKLRWRFRFIAANGEKLGDDYNRRRSALETVGQLVEPTVPVIVRIRELDGTTTDLGRIR